MKKSLIALLAFAAFASAFAQECRSVALASDAYLGQVATITKVTKRTVTGRDAVLYKKAIRYDFIYSFPNGRVGASWTVRPEDDQGLHVGDAFAWLPAPKAVQAQFPNEKRYAPTVFSGKDCKRMSVDFSSPAKDVTL